jgi:menaquinone-9 beta-reductase
MEMGIPLPGNAKFWRGIVGEPRLLSKPVKSMAVKFDVGIVGGGLAGLALAIQTAKAGRSVVVFEKQRYPFHKVCGEYISMESWEFVNGLGVDLQQLQPSNINRLQLSNLRGKLIHQHLEQGGFGISRYLLDASLAQVCRKLGVEIKEGGRVDDIQYRNDSFMLSSTEGEYEVAVAAGSFGKRSNIDVKWNRPFVAKTKNALNNYVGVKWHVRYPSFPNDTVALHLFDKGYCGLVKIEGDLYNLCYMTTAHQLQNAGGIEALEQKTLSGNPRLKAVLEEVYRVETEPVTIAQISFDRKSLVENHVMMVGDAAGMIAPLCGNGMSMALHASKLAAEQIIAFLDQKIGREELEQTYKGNWRRQFSRRLWMGRKLQGLMGNYFLASAFVDLVSNAPGLMKWLIRQTHGRPF